MIMGSFVAIALATVAVGQTSNVTYHSTISSGLVYPARLAPAPGGGIYVTDPPMKLFAEYSAAGALVGTHAIAEGAIGIAVHTDGRIFISRDDGSIGVYSAAFAFLYMVNPNPLTLTGPNDLAFDSTTNELYAVDSGSNRIMVFVESTPETWTLARSWGTGGTTLGTFTAPQAIAIDPVLGRVLVTDVDNFRVQVFDTTGIFLFKFGYRIMYLPTSEVAWFARSEGLAVDACGNIYVADALMGTVRAFNSAGRELDALHTPAVGYGTGPGQLREPCDLMINTGKLYVASTNNAEVEVFTVSCTGSSATAAAPLSESREKVERSPKDQRLRVTDRNDGSVPVRAGVPQMPDNPAEIVAVMNAGEYREDLDMNRDRVIDVRDLETAVARFGAGTVDDFLTATADGDDPDHPGLNPPHVLDLPNRCGLCHSMDGAPGGMLSPAGQENLCQSCHSAGKIAGERWVGPASDGNSHPWGLPASNADPGPAPDSQVALHLDNGNVRCGTCHNPHESNQGTCQIGGVAPPTPASHIGRCVDGPFSGKLCQSNDQCDNGYIRTAGDRIELCGECHVQYDEWLLAGHAEHEAAPFSRDWTTSGRARCRRCHSGDGYIDFSDGVPWTLGERRGTHRVHDCLVCHSTHGKSQDETLLRIYDDVAIFETTGNPAGTTLTGLKDSATCIACHNGRDPVTDTGLTPHYLLGGAMLLGINAVTTFRGVAYSVDHSVHEQRLRAGTLGCATCHMADGPAPGEPGAGKVGGHTFNMAVLDPDDPDYGFENVANTCGTCHTGLTTFNRTARGDYDGDGTTEGVQDETQGLMDVVQAAIEAKGAVKLPGFPYWKVAQCVGGTNPGTTCTSNSACTGGGTCVTTIVPPEDRPVVEDAIWNWEFVDNSADLGVHNTGYAVGLLQLTYEGLTGTVLPNAYLRYVPAGQAAAVQYVGTDACLTCHGAMAVTGTDYSSFLRSGHPYKLNEVKNGQMPTFPFSSIAGALELVTDNDAAPGDPKPGTDNTLGTPASYDDVSYVIGGFGWKARWIDLAGYIITGTATQYNLETGGMGAYNDNQVDKKYNCGQCHTTGWKDYTSATGDTRNLNRQKNLPGMAGTFYQPGIQCEACHGGGSFHADAPSAANITRIATPRTTADLTALDMGYGKPLACSDCHSRDGQKVYPAYVSAGNRIMASGGFIRHQEQYDEMVGINPDNVAAGAKGPHANLLCSACHNSHTTTVYMDVSGDPPGMKKHCTVCHNATGIGGKEYPPTNDMAGLVDCLDCHMPKMVKSAVSHAAVGTGPATGDIRTHIFQIDLTTTTQFTADGLFSYPRVTGQYACNWCHNGVDRFGLSFPDLVTTIHGGPPPGPDARRGGLLYDKWWVVNGAPAPTGKHPLYPPLPVGRQSGSTTYRCKECHGWEYLGKDGRYESGSHYTGIKGVLDAVTTMTEAEIFAIVKNPNGDGTGGTTVNGHNFAAYGLSDGDINDLVAFIKNGGVIDPSPYINRAGSPGSYTYSFNGNAVAGAALYSGGVNPAVDCSMCHGPDGTAIAFGGVEFVGTLANENQQETFHKIRFGHPGARMTSYYELGMTDAQAADVGAYSATLPQ